MLLIKQHFYIERPSFASNTAPLEFNMNVGTIEYLNIRDFAWEENSAPDVDLEHQIDSVSDQDSCKSQADKQSGGCANFLNLFVNPLYPELQPEYDKMSYRQWKVCKSSTLVARRKVRKLKLNNNQVSIGIPERDNIDSPFQKEGFNSTKCKFEISPVYQMRSSLVNFEDLSDIDQSLKNHYEKDLKINQIYFDKIIEKTDRLDFKLWDCLCDKPDLKIYLSKNGVLSKEEFPLTYTEVTFDRSFSVESVFNALSEPQKMVEWHPHIKYLKLVDKFCNDGICMFTKYRKFMKEVGETDFLEKQIIVKS